MRVGLTDTRGRTVNKPCPCVVFALCLAVVLGPTACSDLTRVTLGRSTHYRSRVVRDDGYDGRR